MNCSVFGGHLLEAFIRSIEVAVKWGDFRQRFGLLVPDVSPGVLMCPVRTTLVIYINLQLILLFRTFRVALALIYLGGLQ